MTEVVVIPADPSGWHGVTAVIGVVGYACIALAALYFVIASWRKDR